MEEEENLFLGGKLCWSAAARRAGGSQLPCWEPLWARAFYLKEGESRDRLLEMAKVSCPFVLPHCFGLAFGQGRWLGAAERGALNAV